MSAEQLLSRLQRVRRSGPDSWTASCPGSRHQHGDRHPSLHVTDRNGVVLLRCHAHQCPVTEIVAAVGLELEDLFPEKVDPLTPGKPIKPKLYKWEIFDAIRHEVIVIGLIGCDMHAGKVISQDDYERLGVAVSRIERLRELAYE